MKLLSFERIFLCRHRNSGTLGRAFFEWNKMTTFSVLLIKIAPLYFMILLGMMIVGMGLSTVRLRSFDVKLISLSFVAKFLVWPLIIAAIIILNKHSFHFYDTDVYRLMILYAVVPLGGSTVSLAAEFDIYPEKASVAVFLSTIFALFYIPFILGLFVF